MGGITELSVDTRVIAASNKRLDKEVKKGTFRQDLYYRLNVIPIHIPSLEERRDDIVEMAEYFLDFYSNKYGKEINLTEEIKEFITNTKWPGNVRELKNVVEFLVNMVQGDLITVGDLPQYMVWAESITERKGKTLNQMLQNYEKSILESYMKDTKSREEKMEAAKKLGISQATLYRKLSQYDL